MGTRSTAQLFIEGLKAMLRKRLVTVLTINNGVLFRTRNFTPDYRYTLNFVDAWSIDEIILLDITRPGQGQREIFYEVVEQISKNSFVPLTVGGGVKTVDDFYTLLRAGADKISINSAALNDPEIITTAAKLFGSQCVVVSIDAKRMDNGTYHVYDNFGLKQLNRTPFQWARTAQEYGAGEILIQSINRDGMLEGYDNELISKVSKTVDIPVLACSGAGNWDHFVQAFNCGASAVCTTNIYHFTEASIQSAKKHITDAGIKVRI